MNERQTLRLSLVNMLVSASAAVSQPKTTVERAKELEAYIMGDEIGGINREPRDDWKTTDYAAKEAGPAEKSSPDETVPEECDCPRCRLRRMIAAVDTAKPDSDETVVAVYAIAPNGKLLRVG